MFILFSPILRTFQVIEYIFLPEDKLQNKQTEKTKTNKMRKASLLK